MNFKKALLPFFAGALALSLAACSGDDKGKEKDTEGESNDQAAIEEMQKKLDKQKVDDKTIVAVINEEEVDGAMYNIVLENLQMQFQQIGQDPTSDEMTEQLKTQTLDTLVSQTLFLQQAKAEKIEATEDELENEYGALILQFGDEEALEKALKSEGMDAEALKENIRESIVFEKYQEKIAPAEEVTDEEIKAYYDEFTAQSEGEEEIPALEDLSENIKQILVQNEQQQKLAAHIEALKKDAKIELKI